MKDGVQLFGIHAESSFSYNNSQIFNFLLFKGAFFWFDVEVVFCKDVEYFVDISLVTREVLVLGFIGSLFGMNDPIVHKDGEPSQHYLSSKYSVHHHLECGRRICQPKEHDRWLEESFWCEKGGFPFIAWFDMNVVISPPDIELGE